MIYKIKLFREIIVNDVPPVVNKVGKNNIKNAIEGVFGGVE